MSRQTGRSEYDLLKGRFSFSTEPLLFRFLLCLAFMVFIAVLAWAMRGWLIPVAGVRWVRGVWWRILAARKGDRG